MSQCEKTMYRAGTEYRCTKEGAHDGAHAFDDGWVPLYVRGNPVAEKLYRNTDAMISGLSARLLAAEQAVEQARAEGRRQGIEEAAKFLDEWAARPAPGAGRLVDRLVAAAEGTVMVLAERIRALAAPKGEP